MPIFVFKTKENNVELSKIYPALCPKSVEFAPALQKKHNFKVREICQKAWQDYNTIFYLHKQNFISIRSNLAIVNKMFILLTNTLRPTKYFLL